MFDPETETLWSQLLGKGVHGPLEGRVLEHVASVRSTWREWRRRHPETLALAKPAEIAGSPYQRYFDAPDRYGISGEELTDARLPGKSVVLGLESDGDVLAVALASGIRDVLTVRVGGADVHVARDGERAAAWAAEGRRLRWRGGSSTTQLRARGGRGLWDAFTGRSQIPDRPDLVPAPAVVTYWYTWSRYHPNTEIAGAPGAAGR